MSPAPHQYGMLGSCGVKLRRRGQAPLGEIRLVPGVGGAYPLARRSLRCALAYQLDKVGDAARLVDRHHGKIARGFKQMVVRVVERGKQGKPWVVEQAGAIGEESIQSVRIARK